MVIKDLKQPLKHCCILPCEILVSETSINAKQKSW